jgi:hypothetical protein
VTRDGYELELVHAFIRADSVVGFAKGKDTGLLRAKDEGRRLAFSHDQIVRIESYERDRKETVQQVTALPPGADPGSIGQILICGLTMFIVCLPPQTPSRAPEPTPSPNTPPPPAAAPIHE